MVQHRSEIQDRENMYGNMCGVYIHLYVFDCIILKENSFLFWMETAYQRTC